MIVSFRPSVVVVVVVTAIVVVVVAVEGPLTLVGCFSEDDDEIIAIEILNFAFFSSSSLKGHDTPIAFRF